MKLIRIARNSTFLLLLCLVLVQITCIMPPYLACKTAFEGEVRRTFLGECLTCRGESEDVAFAFYQLCNIGIIALLVLVLFLHILWKKKLRIGRSDG